MHKIQNSEFSNDVEEAMTAITKSAKAAGLPDKEIYLARAVALGTLASGKLLGRDKG